MQQSTTHIIYVRLSVIYVIDIVSMSICPKIISEILAMADKKHHLTETQ